MRGDDRDESLRGIDDRTLGAGGVGESDIEAHVLHGCLQESLTEYVPYGRTLYGQKSALHSTSDHKGKDTGQKEPVSCK